MMMIMMAPLVDDDGFCLGFDGDGGKQINAVIWCYWSRFDRRNTRRGVRTLG